MKERWRLLVVFVVLVFAVAWYGARVGAQEHAKPRDRDRGRTHTERERVDRDNDRHRHRGYDRYHWRNWNYRQRWDRDRFPRSYFGPRIFGGCSYRGRAFGPHGRLWYLFRRTWQMFYWPYPYAPRRGCEWYWVPAERWLAYDDGGDEYWDYSDYRYVRICFD